MPTPPPRPGPELFLQTGRWKPRRGRVSERDGMLMVVNFFAGFAEHDECSIARASEMFEFSGFQSRRGGSKEPPHLVGQFDKREVHFVA